ncbi:MAG: hypothetical protein Q4C70_10610, partial [Planctomycetia bacterium]|nr:hypothetical protein [Planctomycetia bacterium]
MKRLAVIISYYTTPNQLEDSLLSLLENRPDSCDIFVMQCKPYENPYDLDNEEVHFLVAPEVMNEENPCLWESLRKALAACNAEYVCLLPAGVHFQSCWVAALDILDRHDDLGGFFLDENLDNGGFFRKTTLEQYVQTAAKPSENGENMPGNTDADCLYSLVSLIQEDGWTCGLAEFEEKENQEIITEKVTERITEKKSENVGNIPVTVTGCIAGSIAGYATGTVIGNATGVTTENITNAIIGSVTENFTDAVTGSVTES